MMDPSLAQQALQATKMANVFFGPVRKTFFRPGPKKQVHMVAHARGQTSKRAKSKIANGANSTRTQRAKRAKIAKKEQTEYIYPPSGWPLGWAVPRNGKKCKKGKRGKMPRRQDIGIANLGHF